MNDNNVDTTTDCVRKRKVVLYMPSLRGGGAERAMVALANEFTRSGVTVILIVVNAGNGVYQAELSSDVEVIDLGRKRVTSSFISLARELRRIQPEAILSTLYNTNQIALLAHTLAGRPGRIVLREASVLLIDRNRLEKFSHWIAGFLYRRANAFVAVSRAVKEELRDVMRLDDSIVIETVPNSIGTDDIDALCQRDPEPNIEALKGKPFVLAVGRLGPEKGFRDLIHAFSELKHRSELQLVILGEGRLEAELRQLALELGCSDRVFFPGFVLNPYAWMSRCSVFVLSSYYEGSPNVLIQAVGTGCSVVSTNLPGVTDDLLESGKYGRLVPANDSVSMAKAIDESLNSPLTVDIDQWRHRHSKTSVAERYLQLVLNDRDIRIPLEPRQ